MGSRNTSRTILKAVRRSAEGSSLKPSEARRAAASAALSPRGDPVTFFSSAIPAPSLTVVYMELASKSD